MVFIVEAFFSGCISKVINDGKDYSWDNIKRVISDKNDQNISTKIYREIERALNIVTDKKFKDTDKLYDAIEKIIYKFRNNGEISESVKCGLGILGTDVSDQRCENFLEKFYAGICKDDDLYKAVNMVLQQKGIKINWQEFQKLNEKMDKLTKIISEETGAEIVIQSKEPIKSRTQEYFDKWNMNMFLNNFDEWDEKTGVSIKLSEVYIEKHLPHFMQREKEKEFDNLERLLSKYIIKTNENKMLVVLGQPGIGKSTLITWITVKFRKKIDDILVYRFASDLGNVDWQDSKISNRILENLSLNHADLVGKTLILDGFDEVSIEANKRRAILDDLYNDWVYSNTIKKFSLIVTCRENYIEKFEWLKGKYIILQPWDEVQIESFCMIFQEKTKNIISESTMKKLWENKKILGIPLILYMVLALNISIEKDGSIVDVYDKIFALEGGIYDRCIDFKSFSEKHRIGEIKEQIHQISRNIAIWMFENEPEEACINKNEYQNICDSIMLEENQGNKDIQQDYLIGNYFKLVKHCEGLETETLYFVHRSIYEYFVAETIYSSIANAMRNFSKENLDEFAGNVSLYLKNGKITRTICKFLQHKILKLCSAIGWEEATIYQWMEMAVGKMLNNGMFYSSEYRNCNNIIYKEMKCFINLVEILRQLHEKNNSNYILMDVNRVQIEKYIKYCCITFGENKEYYLNLSKMFLKNADLGGANLSNINFTNAMLEAINLSRANLEKAIFNRANLKNANFESAILIGADFSNADLSKADLTFTSLAKAVFLNTVLKESVLIETDLSNANLTRANLAKANLKRANLTNANLRGTDLSDANLSEAILIDVNFENTILYNVILENTIIDERLVSDLEKSCNMQGSLVLCNDELICYEAFKELSF